MGASSRPEKCSTKFPDSLSESDVEAREELQCSGAATRDGERQARVEGHLLSEDERGTYGEVHDVPRFFVNEGRLSEGASGIGVLWKVDRGRTIDRAGGAGCRLWRTAIQTERTADAVIANDFFSQDFKLWDDPQQKLIGRLTGHQTFVAIDEAANRQAVVPGRDLIWSCWDTEAGTTLEHPAVIVGELVQEQEAWIDA